jgi:hypothetical protein
MHPDNQTTEPPKQYETVISVNQEAREQHISACKNFNCSLNLSMGDNQVDLSVLGSQYGNSMSCRTTCTCPSGTIGMDFVASVDTEYGADYLIIDGEEYSGTQSLITQHVDDYQAKLKFFTNKDKSYLSGSNRHGVNITRIICSKD